jgi:hypothetical protein
MGDRVRHPTRIRHVKDKNLPKRAITAGSRWRIEVGRIGARRQDQLPANLVALDLILMDAQMAQLNEVSKPVLNFPADINNHVASMFGFPGTTIDGHTAPASPMLSASANLY